MTFKLFKRLQQLLTATGQSSLDDIPETAVRHVLEYHVITSAVISSDLPSGNVERGCNGGHKQQYPLT